MLWLLEAAEHKRSGEMSLAHPRAEAQAITSMAFVRGLLRVPRSRPHARQPLQDEVSVARYGMKCFADCAVSEEAAYSTHSLRRTKATLIYRRTRNLRAVQFLLGHTKLEGTVRYLGFEVEDALEIAGQTEVSFAKLLSDRDRFRRSLTANTDMR